MQKYLSQKESSSAERAEGAPGGARPVLVQLLQRGHEAARGAQVGNLP